MALVAGVLAASCSSLSEYATRNAERECAQITTCTVYDSTGEHLSPCWTPAGRWGTIYPGDPQWPFAPGVCDTPSATPS
jgi:hypothetical protein